METPVNNHPSLYADVVAITDLALIKVMGAPRPQTFRARVERIYTTGQGLTPGLVGSQIEFVGGSGWGDEPLAVGDRALVFLGMCGDTMYEHSCRGHMFVEEIDGHPYAVCIFEEMWLDEHIPQVLRDTSRQDPKRPYASAVRFEVMEKYLMDLIKRRGRSTEQP